MNLGHISNDMTGVLVTVWPVVSLAQLTYGMIFTVLLVSRPVQMRALYVP